jgi:Tfp pilus assembly protein PilO
MKNLLKSWNKFLNAVARKGVYFGALVGLVPASLIFYCGYVLFVEPGRISNQDTEKNVQTIEAEVAKGRAVEASEPEFKKEFTKIVGLFYDSLPLLPKETELASVLMSVQESAKRYNVTLTGLVAVRDAQKTPNADKLYEREMPGTVVGNYDDVMRFFMDVSRKTRILIIRDYIVSSAKDKQSGVRPTFVSVQFSLLAFHAPPTSEFPVLPPDIKPQQLVQTAQVIR